MRSFVSVLINAKTLNILDLSSEIGFLFCNLYQN